MALYDSAAIRIASLSVALMPWAMHAQTAPAEHGMASWYGTEFGGQRSASGEIYDPEQFTAAHRTLPFGTKVLVRRLDSAESIIVRINDRGPFVESRIIDLSQAAARRLGMTAPGLAPVSLQIVEAAPDISSLGGYFAVQAGSFRNVDNARRTREEMEKTYGEARIVEAGGLWRVQVGRAATQLDAQSLASTVRHSNKAFASAFVVRVDPPVISAE